MNHTLDDVTLGARYVSLGKKMTSSPEVYQHLIVAARPFLPMFPKPLLRHVDGSAGKRAGDSQRGTRW